MKKLKIVCCIIQILMILLINCTTVKATDFLGNVIQDADNFLAIGEDPNNDVTTPDEGKMKSISDEIYVILLTIAVIVAIIVGGILGIQFIIASAEDKAKVKEALIPYVIGCIVSFGAFGIWKAVVLVLN